MSERPDPVEVIAQAVEYLLAARERELAAGGAPDDERALLDRLRRELQAARAERVQAGPEAG